MAGLKQIYKLQEDKIKDPNINWVQYIYNGSVDDSGEIIYQGKKTSFSSSEEAMANGIAYLPEDRKAQGLFPILSTAFNISVTVLKEISSRMGIVQNSKEKELGEKYVKELTIKTPSLDTKVYSLSGGNQQKVVIAKVLQASSEVVILDEPTRGVDIGAKFEIYKLINDLVAKGIAVIMISSELPEILGMSHRILVLSKGKQTSSAAKVPK